MTSEQLRKAHQARPFKPFILRLADGRECPVPHAEFLFITPPGRTVIVSDPEGALDLIDLLLVASLQFRGNGRSRRRKSIY